MRMSTIALLVIGSSFAAASAAHNDANRRSTGGSAVRRAITAVVERFRRNVAGRPADSTGSSPAPTSRG